MAVTYASGVSGNAVIPAAAGGQTVLIRRWECEIVREVFDATFFTAASHKNSRKIYGGMHHLVGSCEAVVDSGEIPQLGTMLTENAAVTAGFKLWCVGAVTGYEFAGIIGRISVSVERRGEAIVTMNFESSGTITRTQAA